MNPFCPLGWSGFDYGDLKKVGEHLLLALTSNDDSQPPLPPLKEDLPWLDRSRPSWFDP
jgi:hypothetical protein